MTNEQTVVLLNNYLEKFSEAKDDLELQLPEELKTQSKNILGQRVKYYPQTNSLENVISSLKNDIESLGGKTRY